MEFFLSFLLVTSGLISYYVSFVEEEQSSQQENIV